MRRGWSLAAFVPFCASCALCALVSCESEVTLHLLRDPIGGTAGRAAAGGASGVAEAGSDGVSTAPGGEGGDAGSGAGDAGVAPTEPCQKLGPEVCNGGDDDCNGAIDDGCDFTITWTKEPDRNAFGHPTGGVMFLEPCATGSLLTGLRVGAGNWLDQVSAICRAVALHADAGAFSATLGARVDMPTAPATPVDPNGKLHDLLCPDGSIVSGVDGTTTEDGGDHLLGMRISCAPPIVVTVGSKTWLDSDRGQEATVGPIVCSKCSVMQAYNYANTIPAGRVASGLFGSAGVWVDRVGFSVSLANVIEH